MCGMNKEFFLGAIFGTSFLGFCLLYLRMGKVRLLSRLLNRTREGMESSARQRLLADRIRLGEFERRHSLWMYLEKQLHYSGLHIRFPNLTVEKGIAVVLFCEVLVFLGGSFLFGKTFGFLACGVIFLCLWILVIYRKAVMMRKVNENLLKFLDFCGNYSISVGEVTGVLEQVSLYVEDPLKTVLNECYVEAKITGDTGMALLAMAEKVEHPMFKEIVGNMEISIRYCADFKALVASSRRSVREYLRMREERRGILREASINMGLLLLMSVCVMLAVDCLLDGSIWRLLLFSVPGHIALGIIAGIVVLFFNKVYKL